MLGAKRRITKAVIWAGCLLLVSPETQAQRQQQIKLKIESSERRPSTVGYADAIVVSGLWGEMHVVLICDASDRKHCGSLKPGEAVFRVSEDKNGSAVLTTTQNGKTLRFTRNSLHIDQK